MAGAAGAAGRALPHGRPQLLHQPRHLRGLLLLREEGPPLQGTQYTSTLAQTNGLRTHYSNEKQCTLGKV